MINGIEAQIKSFKFQDNIDKADTAEITLADNEHKFIHGGAIPAKGSNLKIALAQDNAIFNCGSFELDKINYKSPPSELTLHLNSVPSSANLRGSTVNRAWEQTTLRKIAGDIAGDGGLSLFFDAPDINITRAEQNSSGLSFLQQLCKSNGLDLKVANGKLIVFSAEKYEQRAAVANISYGDKNILRYDFNANATDIYSGANVNFSGNGIAEWLFSFFGINLDLISTTFSSGSNGSILNINERVDSLSEAERLSKARLREKNENEFTANFDLTGDFRYCAGSTINISGFGIFSGKYIIKAATHSIGSGYKTNLQLNKCLSY